MCVPRLSVTATVPLRVPVAVGLNVTEIVHVPFAPIGLLLTQVLFCAKSPLALTALTVRELDPVLLRVTVCTALMVLST
jgi:hypothetical protein